MNRLDKYTDKEYLESEVAKKKAKDDGKDISDYAKGKDSALGGDYETNVFNY